MNADGSGQAQRTFNAEDDQKPAWSPDGTRIVFQASRSGDDQIHVIDPGGGNETAVTDASNSSPATAARRCAGSARLHLRRPAVRTARGVRDAR